MRQKAQQATPMNRGCPNFENQNELKQKVEITRDKTILKKNRRQTGGVMTSLTKTNLSITQVDRNLYEQKLIIRINFDKNSFT